MDDFDLSTIAADADAFDAALATLARTNLHVFAQYVLRNESPGAVGLADGEEWSIEAIDAIEAEFAALGDSGDYIELQPYHLDLLDAYAKNQFLSVVAHTESGKTQLAIAYILWRLGKNPRLRVAVVSEGARLALIICRTIARYISEESFTGCQALRRVFPHLKPGPRWGDQFYGVDRPAQIKDPSFAAFGEKGGITGIRADITLCDDLVTPKTTASPSLRANLITAFNTKVQNRKTPRGQIINQCNAQWSDDLSAVLEERGFKPHRMRVTKDGTPDGELEWAGKWTRALIKSTIQINADWRAMLFAERRQVGEFGRFGEAFLKEALDRGRGRMLGGAVQPRPGAFVAIGMDFAFGGNDKCAIAAVLVEPPAPGDVIGMRTLLDLRCAKWTDLQAIAKLQEVAHQYPDGKFFIRGESNGAQAWVVRAMARATALRIRPYVTGGSKWSSENGIPQLASEFECGLWTLPSDNYGDPLPEVAELLREMRKFDPAKAGDEHTGDRLMALFFADGLARETKAHEYLGGFLGDTPAPPAPEPTAPGAAPAPPAPDVPGARIPARPVEAPKGPERWVPTDTGGSWNVNDLVGGGFGR